MSSTEFIAAPAAFNAFAAHAAFELADLRQDETWSQRGTTLAAAMDAELWDEAQGLWIDKAVLGGGPSVTIPTLDGIFGALVTDDESRAMRALTQLVDPARFGTDHGLAFLPPGHERFQPEQYWRGPAWPQLNYMAAVAARRRGAHEIGDRIAAMSINSATASGFAEFWDPLTGRGLGAIPQGWAALAAVFASPGSQPDGNSS
jgi:glycogen debranching enzyme